MTTGPVPLILSETPLRRFRPFGGPSTRPRAGVARVVSTNRGDIMCIADRHTPGEAAFGPSATQYEVDVAHHTSAFTFNLKSENDGYAFATTVEATWQVHDPVRVVQQRVTDGGALVRHHLRNVLAQLSRGYDIEQTRDLEQAVATRFARPSDRLLDGCVLVHSLTIEVALDDAGQKWLQARRDAMREKALIGDTHTLALQKQEHEQELSRRQAKAEIKLEAQRKLHERDLDAQQRRHDLEIKRLEQELELTRRRQEQQLEIAAERERTSIFLTAMERGDAAVLATHLGRHPDDAKEIVRMIIKHKATSEERQAKLLAEMFDKGMIIGADLEGVSAELVRTVMGLVTQHTTGVFSMTKILDMQAEALPGPAIAVDADAEVSEKGPAPEDADNPDPTDFHGSEK